MSSPRRSSARLPSRRFLSLAGAALLALLCAAPSLAASDDGWQVVFESDTLRVLRRDYSGSALDEVRGELHVRASLNALMALLKDAPFNRHWVYRSGGARILRESGYAQAWVYGVVDAPFPIADRDSVVRFDYVQNPVTAGITVTINNAPGVTPAVPGLVRVPDIGGFWALQPQDGGWVEVAYQIHGDPGGWIPVWLANRAAQASVKYTLQNLAQVVGRYADAHSALVREPP